MIALQAARSTRRARGLGRLRGSAHPRKAGSSQQGRMGDRRTRETRASRRSLAHVGIRASATGDARGAAFTRSVASSRQSSHLSGLFLELAALTFACACRTSSSVHPSRVPVARMTPNKPGQPGLVNGGSDRVGGTIPRPKTGAWVRLTVTAKAQSFVSSHRGVGLGPRRPSIGGAIVGNVNLEYLPMLLLP